ncbi:Mitochondrial carnitine/acylcarnitine carrier protein CACL [Ceratobasidium theobromae]|uniref:Mitochondrial carnitine/acylcarnitine carrier protein CACL n=1 Tax=Ceratobasidium theobromae TaxID=1582974 RepID=A0A5N5QLK6_9AGAM|nr:Mitochondrial carnitine/acylcarnitine carrier protein CACL [Ceratobasidium theobromae]
MVGLAVGFPFDTVKVRLQHPETMNRYRNSTTALMKIVKEERVAGLFKGISSPMAGCAFLNGLVFAGSGFFLRAQLSDPDAVPTLTQITLAGAGTGILGSLIATPTELIKIRQQANTTAGAQPSAWAVARGLWKSHGVRGLYRGISSTAMRDTSYGAYFATYEGMRRLLTSAQPERVIRGAPVTEDGRPVFVANPKDGVTLAGEVESEAKALSWPRLMVAGGVAGIAGWIFTFHLDSIKTRVQSIDYTPPAHHHSSSPSPGFSGTAPGVPAMALARGYSASASSPYRTTWSTMMYMYRVEGMRSFWKGLWPTIVRAIPVNMATFGAYEVVVHLMH